jgi:hypothetical protein
MSGTRVNVYYHNLTLGITLQQLQDADDRKINVKNSPI